MGKFARINGIFGENISEIQQMGCVKMIFEYTHYIKNRHDEHYKMELDRDNNVLLTKHKFNSETQTQDYHTHDKFPIEFIRIVGNILNSVRDV